MRHDPDQGLQPFLTRLLLRSALTANEQRTVLDLPIQIEAVDNGQDFVRLGDNLDHACLIIDGLVARFEQTASGNRQTTALHLPGDMADLHSVVLPKTSWALQTLTSSLIGRIPHRALIAAADRYPAVARAFWRDCAVDASIISAWSVALGRQPAKARLAHLLCEMKCRTEAVGRCAGYSFGLPMTQGQLADALGLTSIHVNRTLGSLRTDGLLTMAGGRIDILDWEALVQVADFDSAYLHLETSAELTSC